MDRAPSGGTVLVLFAHPALERSRVNRCLIRAVRDLPGVRFHDLYQAYPDFDIDVAVEQELLLEHRFVVLQHPFYWYSTPALLKEWQDLVLEHGWAYGHEGDALHGKSVLSVVTTGGSEVGYGAGSGRPSVREFLAPIEHTARLCGMEYLAPFVVCGTHRMDTETIRRHQAEYRRVIEALRDGRVDLDAARRLPQLNSDLGSVLRE